MALVVLKGNRPATFTEQGFPHPRKQSQTPDTAAWGVGGDAFPEQFWLLEDSLLPLHLMSIPSNQEVRAWLFPPFLMLLNCLRSKLSQTPREEAHWPMESPHCHSSPPQVRHSLIFLPDIKKCKKIPRAACQALS